MENSTLIALTVAWIAIVAQGLIMILPVFKKTHVIIKIFGKEIGEAFTPYSNHQEWESPFFLIAMLSLVIFIIILYFKKTGIKKHSENLRKIRGDLLEKWSQNKCNKNFLWDKQREILDMGLWF